MNELRSIVTNHTLFTPTRLSSLYSDFKKLKDLNPEGYEANIIAWKSLITQLFQDGKLTNAFILDTETLQHDLTLSNYGKPLGLATVLEELIKSGEFITLKNFKGKEVTWGLRPTLNWMVKQFIYDNKMSEKNGELKREKLIFWQKLKQLNDSLKDQDLNNIDKIFTKIQFKKYLIEISHKLTDLDFEIILIYLERDTKQIIIMNDFIKLKGKGKEEEITESDLQILEIKSILLKLNESNESLELKIQSINFKINEIISQPNFNKNLVKIFLKSKKLAESSLTKQIQTSNQLESIISQINESKTNLQVINCIKSSTKILSSLRSQIGSVESVESLMDDLQIETQFVQETSDVLASKEIEDEEIEDEFKRILDEELKKEEEKEELKKKEQEKEELKKKEQEKEEEEEDVLERFKKLKLSSKIKESNHKELEKNDAILN